MRKLDNNYSFDSKLVDEYIKDLQSKLPEYEININNANDFSVLLTERANCSKCKGINSCNNIQQGYCTDYVNGEFCFSKCKFLKKDNNDLITNYYLPEKLLKARLDEYHTNTESRTKIFKYITDFTFSIKNDKYVSGLYFHGGCSIGKTYTLAVIANYLSENKIPNTICYFPDLVSKLRNDYYSDKNSYEEIIDNLKNTKVLLIDDFGSENMTEWLRDEVLGPLVNYRMSMELPVFITSNVLPEDLKAHIAIEKDPDSKQKADRIISRLISLVIAIDMDDSKKYNR
jgi:primosomal protein DnaI